MRFGVGDNFSKGKQVDFVLGQWTDEESTQLPIITEKANSAIQMLLTVGLEKTMTFVNQK